MAAASRTPTSAARCRPLGRSLSALVAPRVIGLERSDRVGQFSSEDGASIRGRRRSFELLPNGEPVPDVALDLADLARPDGFLYLRPVAPHPRIGEADAVF